MGNPYLNNDESIILATHNVISRSVRSDVILTNQRLILSDSSHAQFRPRTIPLAVIMTITKSETSAGEPIITLSLATQDGATQPRELVFSQKPGKQRSQESDEWIKKLGELAALAREEATRTGISITDLAAAMTAEEAALAAPPNGTPGEIPQITPPKKPAAGACRSQYPKTSSTKARILAIAAILIVVIVIIVGSYVNSVPNKGSSVETVAPTALPTMPPQTMPFTTATTQPTPAVVVTTAPTPVPEIPIPTTGVWVRVESTGNYAGSVGTSGRIQAVNATGVQFYQIPAAQTDFLDISVHKLSGSGDPLMIRVYNNGELVKSGTTSAPMGTVELHFSLKTA
jgi:hypothetical protein